jgi:chemotaxis protein MotA
MDFTTLLGLILTLGMVVLGITVQVADLEQVSWFLDPGSIAIVLGGALGSTILSMPRENLLQAWKVLAVAFGEKRRDLAAVVRSIVRLSEVARRDGILSLEPLLPGIRDPFLARGLRMAVDGNDPDEITITLRNELAQIEARHESGRALLELFARYAPAYGMLGTLIGLILMLAPAHAEASAGPGDASIPLSGMALALVTTFYGVLLANAVALPLADKLAQRDREEAIHLETILHGIRAIQCGDNPRIVEQKLAAFLPPPLRT